MKCPKCGYKIRGANKRKVGGKYVHKKCPVVRRYYYEGRWPLKKEDQGFLL